MTVSKVDSIPMAAINSLVDYVFCFSPVEDSFMGFNECPAFFNFGIHTGDHREVPFPVSFLVMIDLLFGGFLEVTGDGGANSEGFVPGLFVKPFFGAPFAAKRCFSSIIFSARTDSEGSSNSGKC